MKTYWCRFSEPSGIPNDHKAEQWPEGMKGWVSGYGCDSKIWCARVDAESARLAEGIIRACYGASGRWIDIHSIEENELGWRPSGGRFPE